MPIPSPKRPQVKPGAKKGKRGTKKNIPFRSHLQSASGRRRTLGGQVH